MKVSIITISFNSEKTIEQTLKAVKNQTYPHIEHIIIDGNSTDQTLKTCNKYTHISKILSEPDKGVYDAFNKGIKLATGDLIGFLNSDDVFADNTAIETIVRAFDEDLDCVYGNLNYINSKGNIIRKWRSKTFTNGAFKKAWMPAHPTFYCKRDVYNRVGSYDESFRIAGDFELMLRFFEKEKIRSQFINKVLVNMLEGGISNQGLKSKMEILKEEFRAFKKNKILINKLRYVLFKIAKIKEFFLNS
jgi:glycosyltransferase involved in cell wall biosynthesis